jgi:hypothetical protein
MKTLRPGMGPVTVGRNDIRAFLLSPGTASIDSLTRKRTHGALHDKPLMGDRPCGWVLQRGVFAWSNRLRPWHFRFTLG